MTVYTDWPNSGLDWDKPPYESCSANLQTLYFDLLDMTWREGDWLGCHGDRPIRQGTIPSEHSWGAALDWGETRSDLTKPRKIPREVMLYVMDFLIWSSPRSGIQSIHDYEGDRIWRCNRNPNDYPDGWKPQNGNGSGMGEAWAAYIHIVTNNPFHQQRPDYVQLFREYSEVEMKPYRMRPYGFANQVLVDGGMSPVNADTLAFDPAIEATPVIVTKHAETREAIRAFYGGALVPFKET